MGTLPISVIICHFIADFMLQTDWMALNKSKNNWALAAHVFVYSIVMGAFIAAYYPGRFDLFWIVVVFVPHFLTDWVTSRITSRLWFLDMKPITNSPYCGVCADWTYVVNIKPTRHWFFVMIGFDQVLHYVALSLSLRLFS